MSQKITDLKPTLLWGLFDEITQVPRPSKKEEKIIAYLLEFGRKYNLQTLQDATGNIVITKPATPGCEYAPTVILQSHIDMVCEKNSDTKHNFETDPIQTYIDGEWVRARGTTLGADNGIGMAAQLAILASDNLKHGKIEALFTVDEETGLTGAFGLADNMLTGSILLNLDSEDEAELFIGCAGGIDTTSSFVYSPTMVNPDLMFFKIEVKNLLGGHSGCDIHKGLGNANKILARFLWENDKKFDFALGAIDGGNLRNAIPREAYAIVGIESAQKEKLRVALNLYQATVESELNGVEPHLTLVLQSCDAPKVCIDHDTAHRLISALYAAPHGVIKMSKDMEGLVQTSTNLASVKMKGEQHIIVATSQRSSVESEKYDIAQQLEAIFKLAGATVTHGDGYPGWKPNLDSHILKIASHSYEQLYHITPAVKAIHAGLECGLFLKKYPYLDMVSFGPTLQGVHSPDEKMHIPAVEKFWNHLVAILETLTNKQ